MTPAVARLYDAIDGTWPCVRAVTAGPWMLREGGGGGKRVSCATASGHWTADDLAAAESAMRLLGQQPLFMIREGEMALDAALDTAGYHLIDPVNLWVAPVDSQTGHDMPRVTAFDVWEPLAIMREIWAEADIGPARLRVMDRARGPKTGILGRLSDKPAGTAFCAIHTDIAMVHALEIRAPHRGQGLGKWMMRQAALWAQTQGGTWMAALCLADNAPANGLYASLGYECMGQYHYRIKSEAPT
ncbi:acetyltransferase [Salipiger aestuarii]|uniref:Acetyltransferase (GNAT) family protein n=1 Tax=Salipiger aestuarii TaxID=568098 RepID=A0A327Y5W5_9RHOB|nr:GNAT family N-acetyltransferase [Salipiger aestuarii]KAA8607655.1 acetyltransferase [Salipiger aestuarii]KAA8611116.1 acetyltransferase [Salipiger aestuarii]KAB2541882.1 acetyltransferase [Salipiger aestuarii]RAK15406.1 acetyltransferase (GNAT) family protein [Salipiger aestuarii]